MLCTETIHIIIMQTKLLKQDLVVMMIPINTVRSSQHVALPHKKSGRDRKGAT